MLSLDAIGQGKSDMKTAIDKLALAMLILGLCSFTMSTLQVALFQLSSTRQTDRLRKRLLKSILRQEIGWFDTNNGGELSSILTKYVSKV